MPPAAKKKDAPALPISDRTVASLVQYFKLLADDSRLRILLTLAREGETHVSALCQMLGQSQPAVSHHLTLLRMSGLVGFRRDGKFNFYRMDASLLGDMLERLFADTGKSSQLNFGEFSLAFSRTTGRRR
jgi:ArsR family transcriptional regulator, arsenate/arsenite/antimonite-responsive transcriptional repressor